MTIQRLLMVAALAMIGNAASANPLHPGFPPSPPRAIRPSGSATVQSYNPIAEAIASAGLTPGRAYVLTLLDQNGNQTATDIVVSVGPDLLDPKGAGVTLDFWDASGMQSDSDPAVHLGQAFFKINRSGITFYGWKEGENPVVRTRTTTLFPKGIPITTRMKAGSVKTGTYPSRDGYSNPVSVPVTTNVGAVLNSPNLLGFLWQTGPTTGIQIIVTPGSGLAGFWLGGYYYEVTH